MPHRRYWGQLDRATFAFGYGLMVTPLQLAHVYATIGGFGIERPLSITRIDPPVIGTRVMPENIVHSVEHMMESVALPGRRYQSGSARLPGGGKNRDGEENRSGRQIYR